MTQKEAQTIVFSVFARGGYVRTPNKLRRAQERSSYKKGYEARFPVFEGDELEDLLQALKRLTILPGKPFKKSNRVIVPVYGAEQVLDIKRCLEQARKP